MPPRKNFNQSLDKSSDERVVFGLDPLNNWRQKTVATGYDCLNSLRVVQRFNDSPNNISV